MRIGFIGGGVMAEALIAGMRRAMLEADITVGEPVEARREALASGHGVSAVGDNIEAIRGAGLIVLAVKPQQLDSAAGELAGKIEREQTVLSIIAGVRMHSIGLRLNHQRLIRVMPNTPAQIGAGMSVWTTTAQVSAEIREFAGKMLDGLGEHLFVQEEKYVDMATALSASGPAYVFAFIEALIDAGVHLGMPSDMARKLVLQTLAGSTALVRTTGRHPAELRNMVTSPGGTTAAGLLALDDAGFRAAVIHAVRAAYERGEQLGTGK